MDFYSWVALLTMIVTVLAVWKVRKRPEYKYTLLDTAGIVLNTVLIVMVYPPLCTAAALLGIGSFAAETLSLVLEQTAVAMGRLDLAVVPAALVGGLVAYLFYNWHPAKVFMGDTGSLFLGGVVCGLAFALDMPLILILVGFIYICETLSVILQVGYFKLTHGKRLFKMSPIHHHFEMCGWKEEKIVLTFTAISAVMCVLAWLGIQGLIG